MGEFRDQIIYFPKRNVPIVVPTRLLIGAVVVVLGMPITWLAHAQQKADPLAGLQADWQAMASLQIHVQDDLNALVQAYQAAQKKAADLEAFWKSWCGESPGCDHQPKPVAKK